MKQAFVLICLLIIIVSALAADTVKLGNGDNSIQVISSSATETILQYTINHFETDKVEINGSDWYTVTLPREGITQDKGFPQLPVFNRSIIIDNYARMNLEVFDIEYQDIELAVVPSKGVITRNIDPATVPYSFDQIYQSKEFYPSGIAGLSDPYILRDFRGITVQTVPFAYNPETKTLRIYTSYRIRVYNNGIDMRNVLNLNQTIVSRDFAPIYENHFVNWNSYRYTPVSDNFGKLLVICHTDFMTTILPYVNWKKQKGIETELIQWSTIGTTAAELQTYIQNRYNTDPTIAYIQIVGDAPQIPTLTSGGGGSDPTFSLVAGGDNYPDIFIGRFSAQTTAEVTAQINKAIVYERDLTTTATWLRQAMGIASAEGGGGMGDNGESDIIHMNGIRTNLLGYGYTSVDQVYDPGALAATVTTNVNAGRGFINYVGHGSDTSWVTSGFNSANASALTNGNKTPVIMDVACVNGNFVSITCFAEAWLRNANGGAVAMYASTINQSWNSPMRAQDHFTSLLTTESKFTAGGLYYNSSCDMMDIYGNTSGSDGVNMFKTWTIFGDASLLVRSKTPIAMSVTHPATIVIGTTTVTVSTGLANALVAITYNNTIYGRGFTNSSGNATITLTSPPTGAISYTITATAFNRVTYVGSIQQIAGTGPFMTVSATNYADSNNSIAEYNETGRFNVTFSNIGSTVATNVSTTLSCPTPGIVITDATESIATLNAGANTTINNAYTFNIANNIANGTSASFTITMVGSATWTHDFNLVINAPALAFGSMIISDPTGNNNGRLDPGETVTISMPLNNTGGSASPAGNVTLTSPTSGITINNSPQSFTSISASGTANITFSVSASSGMTIGTVASLVFNASAGAYTATKNETTAVGIIMEDFETGNFNAYPWVLSGTLPWTIVNTGAYAGTYAAKSGVISHSQTSTMQTVRVLTTGGSLSFWYKVSSESGYDYLRFYIDGVQQAQWAGEIAWTQANYALTAGTRTLAWTYSKDGSVSTGSDCAWVDNIVFPASTAPSIYNPPQNLIGTAGNAVVNLSWQAPASGTPTGYKIFRNSSLLTTVTGLTYSDTAVINETTYSYYVKAAYSGGESDPTATVQVTPSAIPVNSVIIGTGTLTTGTSEASPINIYYDSLHGQAIYTAAELAAAGVSASSNITQIGFFVNSIPTEALPNFVVRMKHTSDTNVTNWQTSTGMVTVYTNSAYLPTVRGYDMLTLSTPFTWNGTGNIVIDTAFSPVTTWSSSGTVQYTSITAGYRYVRVDDADQTSVFTGGSISTYRPNVKLTLQSQQTGPAISVNPSPVAASVYTGQSATPTLTIYNTGTAALNWTTPAAISTWGTVTPTSGTIAAGGNTVLNMTLSSTGLATGTYNSNIVLTSNATNNPSLSVPVNFTVQASPYPVEPRFVAEWEPALGSLITYSGGFGLPYSMIADLSARGKLYVVVTSANQSTVNSLLTSNGVTMSNVLYINPAGTNSYWTRDYGPWTIFHSNNEMGIVDFRYNRVRPYDDALNSTLDDYFGFDYYYMPLVATGGNVMTDGKGKMMSTNLIMTENDGIQNSQVTEYSYTLPQIQGLAQQYLGVSEFQMYTDPLANSSIDHIDCWAKLLDVDKVILPQVAVGHTNYAAIEAAVATWQTKTSSYGTPYKIYRVTQSSSNEPYTNSFIFNNKIYVPQYSSTPSSNDLAAITVYQNAMPGYIVQGYYNSSWLSDDAIHCRVNTIYDEQMIHAWHVPPTSAQANSSVTINVDITHTNALVPANTYVAYRYATTGSWTNAPLSFSSGNLWTANIPAPAFGQTLYYYILATDNTARTAKLPLCGANDPYSIPVILDYLAVPDVAVLSQSSNSVRIQWAPVLNAVSYEVWACDNPYGAYTLLGRTDNPYWDDSTLNQPRYFYKVIATNLPLRTKQD